MSKNERVMDYLLDRIEYLERELKQVRNEKAGTTYGLQKLQEEVTKLNEKIEQYQIEREHIKEIITCNIAEDLYCSGRYEIDLNSTENDFKTLLAILDIKSEDYVIDDDIDNNCDRCLFEDVDGNNFPCNQCNNGAEFVDKEVTEDAKNTD